MTTVNTSGSLGISKLAASAIPFIIPPTGTMGNNGAYSTTNVLAPAAYANAYIWFAASQIFAGSTAGWYYSQLSSTTAATVFNNTYSSGQPTIPASPTPFVSTGSGAITGVTTQTTGPQIPISAGAMGPNGAIRVISLWAVPNNANNKTLIVGVAGGANFEAPVDASVGSAQMHVTIWNGGVISGNVSFPTANQSGFGTASGSPNETTVNFATAQSLVLAGTLAVATDYLVIRAFTAEMMPG